MGDDAVAVASATATRPSIQPVLRSHRMCVYFFLLLFVYVIPIGERETRVVSLVRKIGFRTHGMRTRARIFGALVCVCVNVRYITESLRECRRHTNGNRNTNTLAPTTNGAASKRRVCVVCFRARYLCVIIIGSSLQHTPAVQITLCKSKTCVRFSWWGL